MRRKPADDDRKRGSRYPQKMGSLVNQLMARRGYAQVFANQQLQQVVAELLGQRLAAGVRVGTLKRGVVEIYADDSVTLQELTFMKRKLIKAMNATMGDAKIRDLRFRIRG